MIGVIADDLTGAAELGAVGLRHGLRAEILVRSGKRSSEFRLQAASRRGPPQGGTPSADLICVDTDSRSCTAAEASRRAASAAKQLAGSGAKWIYKKVDSVLRGNVTAEIEAILKQLHLPRALLLPANPALGRVIRHGHYLVRGRPIHETEFARDPEHPRRSSNVTELLGRSKRFPVIVARGDDSLPAGGIVIGEVATVNDLARWAACRKPGTLCAGGSGFFDALLTVDCSRRGNEADRRPAHRRPPPHVGSYKFSGPPELFVCGTTSRSARKFIAAARRSRTPIFSLPRELARGAAFKQLTLDAIAGRAIAALPSHRRVILTIGLPPARSRAIGRSLATHLVRVAATVLHGAEVRHVYIEGGATAIALVRRMGWQRFIVRQEAAPGVATLWVVGEESLLLTIKPGSYEWPTEIRRRKISPRRPGV
jgi:uncharacterized protein YgbK (DUF1537 family)